MKPRRNIFPHRVFLCGHVLGGKETKGFKVCVSYRVCVASYSGTCKKATRVYPNLFSFCSETRRKKSEHVATTCDIWQGPKGLCKHDQADKFLEKLLYETLERRGNTAFAYIPLLWTPPLVLLKGNKTCNSEHIEREQGTQIGNQSKSGEPLESCKHKSNPPTVSQCPAQKDLLSRLFRHVGLEKPERHS